MKTTAMQAPLAALAIVTGLAIAWVDSRPVWDDAGITAGLLVLAAAGFGALRPSKPWLWGLAVGVWVPLLEIGHVGPGSLLALAAALSGAFLGAWTRLALRRPVNASSQDMKRRSS